MPDPPGPSDVPVPEPGTFPVGELLAWYRLHRRSLPWRETRDPYRIWLSEVMLQQTQVSTVVPYYERFLNRFPTIADLARASEEEVLKVWENLGYYARARQLHKAAGIVMKTYGGVIPERPEDLAGLPGVGPYTAGAVSSIAFGQDVAAIDGNVRRVLCRHFALAGVMADKEGLRYLSGLLEAVLPSGMAGDFNQALMELGATICRPREPLCEDCPLGENCLARIHATPEAFPSRREKKKVPVRHAVAAIIRDTHGRVLLVKRQSRGLLGSLWKFPGGFAEPGEEPSSALVRSVQEETGIKISGDVFLGTVRHAYTHFRLRLHVFSCPVSDGLPVDGSCKDFRWAFPGEIRDLPLGKADRQAADRARLSEEFPGM